MQGFYVSSEGPPEATFLLVENYNYMTTPAGLRIGWEFLNKNDERTHLPHYIACFEEYLYGRCLSLSIRWLDFDDVGVAVGER